MDSSGLKRVMIDEWFPITEVSVESIRERSASSALPPLYFLHVWFARRPLVASRAAVLAGLLPPDFDKRELLKLLGIPPDKDVKAAAERLARAKASGERLTENPFTWPRAYTQTPSKEALEKLREIFRSYWGKDAPVLLDPMAGGGSIPFEALRLGLPVIAGELNPVAYVILKATLEYPLRFRERLIEAVRDFCMRVHEEAKKELEEFFPKKEGELVYAYLWARTIRCPTCGLYIPMSPNWWIVRSKTDAKNIAVKPIPPPRGEGDYCSFEIIYAPKMHGFNPDEGTDIGKEARCPRCGTIIDGETVKREAQNGRMGHQLYAVATKTLTSGRSSWKFRAPTKEELEAVKNAEKRLEKKLSYWMDKRLPPFENFPVNAADTRPIQYGMSRWMDLFNPRQLLTHLTYLEKIIQAKKELLSKAKTEEEKEFAKAVTTYVAMIFDSCVSYSCLLSRWENTRTVIKSIMDVQGFPFKSSYAEWNQLVPKGGFEWALEKVLDALKEIIRLLPSVSPDVKVYLGDAANIPLPDKSVDIIVVDPPYHENVMYGEVSDFFYVWLKRILGDIFPEAFKTELTDKTEEAVANPARFKGAGKGMAKKLATQHYESKIEACFRDMHRVLRDDGVMIVMFTHRKFEAWASLAKALINAGFTFTSSWPIATEPGEKFGKKGKGVLKYTVLLTCRKRLAEKRGLWEEIRNELMELAEKKVREHAEKGITGPDLLVSVYGPILGRMAEYSVIKDARGHLKTPEDALELAAEVVNKFLAADVKGVDLETRAYINLLRNFPQLEVEYDLARLTTVFGGNISLDDLDIRGGKGLVVKQKGKVRILLSKDRIKEGKLNPNKPETLKSMIDIVHAALIRYENIGIESVKSLLEETGRDYKDSGFISVLRAIAQLAYNGNGSKRLMEEARTAATLLESLGMTPEVNLRKGERITHYI